MTAVIETTDLTKRYGRSCGIEGLSMTVRAGEVFGFLGPNRAGKTTTIRTVLDFLHPTRGFARVFGLDSRRDRAAVHARVGNLPGDFSYQPRLTGREVLAFFAELRGVAGLGRAPALAKRFEAHLDRPLGVLSRGSRQEIGLIQATFHEPELLMLDEPTSGLDPLMQEEFLRFVREERERGAPFSSRPRAGRGRARMRPRRHHPRGTARRRGGRRRDHRPFVPAGGARVRGAGQPRRVPRHPDYGREGAG